MGQLGWQPGGQALSSYQGDGGQVENIMCCIKAKSNTKAGAEAKTDVKADA